MPIKKNLSGKKIQTVHRISPLLSVNAENYTLSKKIPQAWSCYEVDVTKLVAFKKNIETKFLENNKCEIGYLSFVVKAVVDALKSNPQLNSYLKHSLEFLDLDRHDSLAHRKLSKGEVGLNKEININISIISPYGKVSPVIRKADTLSITQLSKEIHTLTNKAEKNKLTLDDVTEGTFTINNLGFLGGALFTKNYINLSGSSRSHATLTVDSISRRVVVDDNDEMVKKDIMNIGISYDLRIIDEGDANAFMVEVKNALERFGNDIIENRPSTNINSV